MLTLFLAVSITACKSKPKDTDLKAAVETALKANPDMAGMLVDVKDGVATLSGECKDDGCKSKCEELAKAVTGISSVVNNCTVAAPPPPPVVIVNSADDTITKTLTDVLKDLPAVKGSVKDGIIALTGEIAKVKWVLLKQTLDKLTPKGYDLKGLKVK